MLYFLLTTGECNLACRYCGGSFPKEVVPWSIQYDPSMVKSLIEGDPDSTVAFYGGEPLVNSDFIRRMIDSVDAKRFVIQTNGLLEGSLDRKYWNRMDAVLLSVDGTRGTTDFYRGKGVYDRVVRTAKALKENGFRGDLIARMAVSERSDIFEEVSHLLSLRLFDHVHWQLDAGWSDCWQNFKDWCEGSYKPGILKLADRWRSELQNGRVLGLVPFLGILKRMREGGPIPPCGSGSESFSVMPDGSIRACPISADASWAFLGKLPIGSFSDLPRVNLSGACDSCSYLRVCGGRCLYFNRERLWGAEGFRTVCELTKFTIDTVAALEAAKDKAVAHGWVSFEDVYYPLYNNSTEIIP